MEKEKVYVLTTSVKNTEEQTEITNRIVLVTKNEEKANNTMEELFNEVEENYEENGFACSEDDWENENSKGVVITREDLLEEITIEITRMEVE